MSDALVFATNRLLLAHKDAAEAHRRLGEVLHEAEQILTEAQAQFDDPTSTRADDAH